MHSQAGWWWRSWLTVAGLACLPVAAKPAYQEQAAQALGHLTLVTTADTDPAMASAIADVCEVAAAVYQQDLKLAPPAELKLYVCPSGNGHCAVVTDRRTRIVVDYTTAERSKWLVCINYLDPRQLGPVHVLCRAVAELFNPHRVPGIEELLASGYGVPAVLDQLGTKAWPSLYDIDERDGEKGFADRTGRVDFLAVHPRWAAAAAWQRVIEVLKPEGFAKLLSVAKGHGRATLATLRKLAAAQDPRLEAAFRDWDEATDLPVGDDGSLLLTSFESAETARFWHQPFGVKVSTSADWATDGKRSAVLSYTGVGAWPRAINYDPDWRFGDWSQYGSLEFDARNPGDEPVELMALAADDESFGSGVIERWFTLPAHGQQHCVLPLTEPNAQHAWYQSVFWSGQVRLDDIRVFELATPKIKAQAVLWVDNLRLKP